MNSALLHPDIQNFINKNINESISKLALQKNPFPEIEWITVLNQIEAKGKAKDKLPTWFETEAIIYPNKISIEQTSSEKTAQYKANLISGDSLIDLTGGFGVDDYYFSKKIKNVVHCELNPELSAIVQHNFKQLKVDNCICYPEDSFEILKKSDQKWDWIYIDPSRRKDSKGKVFMLKDCLPNVPSLLDFYLEKSDSVLIKTSPLLDLSVGLSDLKNVKKIHIIAVKNEVKELLWEICKGFSGQISISTANISEKKTEFFEFKLTADSEFVNYSLARKYLYEPNSAIMKSGRFDELGSYFKIAKLHKFSHLYTSDDLIAFPGRTFEVQKTFLYTNSKMKLHLSDKQVNITTRNFREKVEEIRKRWKIKEGGDLYCFFTTDMNNDKIVLICKKNNMIIAENTN